jgi:hypothetical protein
MGADCSARTVLDEMARQRADGFRAIVWPQKDALMGWRADAEHGRRHDGAAYGVGARRFV